MGSTVAWVIVDCWAPVPRDSGLGSILEVVAMTTTAPDAASGLLVPAADPLFTVGERQALAGFLSGYPGLTRDAYTLDSASTQPGARCRACICSPSSR